MKSPISQSAKISGMLRISRSPLLSWGIVFGLTILYVLCSIFLLPVIGPATVALSAFPLAATGWYFGLSGGILASLAAMILNNYLMATFGGIEWYSADRGGFILGASILIMVGAGFAQFKKFVDVRLHVENQLQLRDRYHTLLKIATTDILNSTDPISINHSILSHLVDLFIADHGYLVRWDAAEERSYLLTTTIQSLRFDPKIPLEQDLAMMTEKVIQTERVLAVDDLINSQYVNKSNISLEGEFQAQAALVLPLFAGKNKYAAILAYYQPRQFTADEINQAQQAGEQIALVWWTVTQEAEIQKRFKETNTLVRIGQVLGETERIGLSTVLHLIVSSAKELIPAAEQAVIHLLDEEKQILKAEAVIGYENSFADWKLMKIQPNEGVAGQVIVSGETTNIADVTTDSRFLALGSPPSFRSLMVAAVKSGDRKLGTISVQSTLIGAFTEDENRLLSALGAQAAVAIENAHLLEKIQKTLNEVNALYRVNQGLVASLDTSRLLRDTVELLQKNFGYYHVQIFLVEQETGNVVFTEGSGEIGRKLKEKGYFQQAGEGIIGYTAETGEAIFTNDVDQVHFFVRGPYLPDTKSELAVPVKIDGRTLGVLDIQQVPPAILTQRDTQLVSAVADQLAVALQKAKLYEELHISLEQEKTIRNQLVQNERLTVMGKLLASVSHELNNPLQAIQNALFLLKEERGISGQGKLDLDIVLAESERMAHMIEQLRATYRPIQTEDFRPTQLNSIVEDVHTLLSSHLRHNRISFEFHAKPDLPPILAISDQIRQVVLNLFMNAVEAMSSGGKLSIETNLAEDNSEVVLTVTDTGPGISPAILPNIFEAFVTDKQKGTGLGLTITYDIVIKHRGQITAENNSELGSTFKVRLPVKSREIE